MAEDDEQKPAGARGDDAGDAGQLLLSYGINDCEAKLARMPLREVRRMLRPLAGESSVCVPVREH